MTLFAVSIVAAIGMLVALQLAMDRRGAGRRLYPREERREEL